MDIILVPLIFCVALFIYLHICFHNKRSDDLELYEIDNISKDKLEEVCDLKQPVIFNFDNSDIQNIFNKTNIQNTYGVFDINVRDTKKDINDNELLYLNLNFDKAVNVFDNDKDEKYLTENNSEFLEETGLIKMLKINDLYLRPHLIMNSYYDIQFGSNNSRTPFKYEMYNRNYILVTEGSIKLKLTPSKYKKYLFVKNDYENFEFKSEINPWDVNYQHKDEFNKVKCLEVELNKGQIIYVPPYWFYSIEFGKDSMICNFKYQTYMSNLCISHHLLINILQNHNIQRKYIKNYKV
jgi:hypothetical protein